MKNALILHGTGGSPQENWFDWLRQELEKRQWKVWVPQLPHAEKPNLQRYNKFLFSNENWQFNEESILIGHSSGAVAILSLLQNLPDDVVVHACFLVSAFHHDLGWDALKELFLNPFDFEKIKKHAKKIILIHSDDDPYCPLDEHAKYLKEKLNAELIVVPGQKHFSVGTAGEAYHQFPLLLQLIEERTRSL